MLTFAEFNEIQLTERFVSIGLTDKDEKFREQYRNEMVALIVKSYEKLGGYNSAGSGSTKEAKIINDDISDPDIIIKAVQRGGKITALNFYKKQFGRKSIVSATDGTPQGKSDWLKIKLEDNEQKRAWGETSGAVEHIHRKIGSPVINPELVQKLIKKNITAAEDGEHYSRDIGGVMHTKLAVGHPKI